MKWKLQDKSWNAVAEVEMPDDVPDIVIFEGRLFFYDERVEQYVTPTIYVAFGIPTTVGNKKPVVA